jgi:hypothetical protein
MRSTLKESQVISSRTMRPFKWLDDIWEWLNDADGYCDARARGLIFVPFLCILLFFAFNALSRCNDGIYIGP